MATALVRVKDNKDIVGVFAYKNKHDLCYWVDECVSPFETEYMVIDSGGIFFPFKESYDNATLSGSVYNQLDNKKWHTFTRKDLWGEDYE